MTQTIFPNLVTEDIETTVAWYERNLGATFKMSVPSKVTPETARFATIVVAGNDIMFQTIEDIEDKYPHLKDRVSIGYGIALNVQVDDAQAVYEQIVDTSGIIKEPADMFYGMREFTIEDPNGYVLTVASMLAQPEA